MKLRIAINGFGRIGKNFLRAVMSDETAKSHLDIVVINSPMSTVDSVAYDIKYDSILGTYTGPLQVHGDTIVMGDTTITVTRAHDSFDINWKKYDIDWVVDCSGHLP